MHPVCGCFTLFWLDRPENWSTCLKPGVLDPDPLSCPIRMLLLLLVLLLLLLLLHEKQHWKCKRDEAAAAGPFFSSVFFFTTFPFCPFWQWVLIAFGRDPFRVHWPRFRLLSIWQGARCAVWRRVDATTSRQLLVTSFGTWLPVQPGVRTSH